MNFLFIFYFLGLLIAIYQDFTRREIDDWLNLFLFFSGVLFLGVFFDMFRNSSVLISFGFFILIVSLLSFAFYYGRFFSGGDSKLFFALSPLLFTPFLESSFFNLFYFIIFLFVFGSVYSLCYSFFLFTRDFKKAKVFFIKELKRKYSLILSCIGIVLLIIGLFENLILILGILVFMFLFLFCMAKSLENVSMKRLVNTKKLREGDWLFYDVKIGNKIFKKNWEGLKSVDINYLRKFNKNIFVKDGIPYAPSFLFALIAYQFSSYLLGMIFA